MRAMRLGHQHDAEVTGFLDALGETADGPSVLAYHYPFYRDLLLAALGDGVEPAWLGIRSDCGHLLAVLPGMLRQSDGDACYNSLPFFGPNSGVLAATSDASAYSEWSAKLVQEALTLARDRGALSATFYSRFVPAAAGDRPCEPPIEEMLGRLGLCSDEVVTIPKETLYLPLDDLPSEWPAKIRYDLRRTEAAGVCIVDQFSPADIERVVEMHNETCAACSAPTKPASFIRGLLTVGSKHVGAWGAVLDGRLIGALIVLFGPQTASYYLPCSDSAFRGLQPVTFLIDRAVAAARQRGIRYWNFESSPIRDGGVWSFKKKWGAVDSSYQTTAVRLRPLANFRSLGSAELTRRFPYFYVYPHALLA